MFREKIYKLYLSKSKLVFKDEFGIKLNFSEEVGDYSVPILHNEDTDKYCPDYYITGFFRKINKGSLNEFIISRKGPDILFITGVEKGINGLHPFRFKNRIFSSYYEDEVKGCLFQVLKRNVSYIGESKLLGIKQFN